MTVHDVIPKRKAALRVTFTKLRQSKLAGFALQGGRMDDRPHAMTPKESGLIGRFTP